MLLASKASWGSAKALCQAESTLRPLALRLFMTKRPPFVAILARKPWVLFILRTLGWNVRFMIITR
mgnify:FL=1|jgi:hypothetical protein